MTNESKTYKGFQGKKTGATGTVFESPRIKQVGKRNKITVGVY